MAEEQQGQEKTEEPTARRLEKAREEGQVVRSQDLNVAVMVILVVASLTIFGGHLVRSYTEVFAAGFAFDRRLVFSENLLLVTFGEATITSMKVVAPIFGIAMVVAILPLLLLGGAVFSPKAFLPKLSKLSIIQGAKRIFGSRALVELGKAIIKFCLIGLCLFVVYKSYAESFIFLSVMPLKVALDEALGMMMLGTLLVSLSLIVVAAVDVPYQKYTFRQRMKMTRQEVRDEQKETEGHPEIRSRIREQQRKMAIQPMLDAVAEADVVVTNPDHFAVALAYDPDNSDPPKVVAAGLDFSALRIRDRAKQEGVTIFEAPQLARSLFYTTEVGEFIPEGLYHAVAEVIAYVFSIGSMEAAHHKKPIPTVPADFNFDEHGRRMTS